MKRLFLLYCVAQSLLFEASTTRLQASPGDIIGTFVTGGPIYASPTLSPDGTIHVGSNDSKCYAINSTANGLQQKWVYTADDWIDSTAAIGPDGNLYVATYNSTLVALDPSTGSELWTVSVGEQEGAFGVIQSSPAIADDGTIIITTTAGFTHAIDPSGDQLWSFEMGSESQSSPAIDANGNIYFGASDGKLYCLNSLGEMQWAYAVDDPATDTSRLYSSPAIDSDGHIYIGSGNGNLYSITSIGTLRWKYQTVEAVDSSPAIDQDNQIYFGSRNGSIYCVDQGGILIWSSFLGDIFYSSPVIDANGFLYVTYFGGQGRTFVTAFAPGGAEVWQTQIDAVVDSSLTIAPDGTLYVGAFDGIVYAIEGSGSPLDYSSPWPRFRKDTRSRGRVIQGSLPTIVTPPTATIVMEGKSAEFFVETTKANTNNYYWRRNGELIEGNDRPRLGLSTPTKEAIAVYDVIISNNFGETLSPLTYLSLYSTPTYDFASGIFQFSTQFTYPESTALGNVLVTHSTDLLNWSSEGVIVEALASGNGSTDIRASIRTLAPFGFLRLEN